MRTDVRDELIPAGIARMGEQSEEAAEDGGWIKCSGHASPGPGWFSVQKRWKDAFRFSLEQMENAA